MPFDLGPMEIAIILVIIFIIFGAGKLPEAFGAMGKAIRAFRESQNAPPVETKPVSRKKKRTVRKTSRPGLVASQESSGTETASPSNLPQDNIPTGRDAPPAASESVPPPPEPSQKLPRGV